MRLPPRVMSRTTKETLDFIVIGVQKAGTTSLFEYIKRHPEIYVPPGKEVPYFSDEPRRACGWDDYLRKNFAFADPGCKWGTVTTHYMFGAIYEAVDRPAVFGAGYDERTVPRRIYESLPDVRLVAILRDPVERARSHHRMALMNGLDQRSFDEAIEELLLPESLERDRRCPSEATGYVVWGEYGRLLAGYLDVFPREQILILFTDELERTPERLLYRLHEFVGVTPHIMPDNLGTRYREGSAARRFFGLDPYAVQEVISRNRVTRALWHTLPEASRRWCDREFAHIAYWTDLWNRRKGTNYDDPETATVVRLREHFEQDSDRLVELIGEVPTWQGSADAA